MENRDLSKRAFSYLSIRFFRVFHNNIFRNVSIVFAGKSLSVVISIVSTWVLLKYLKPEEYGIFSIMSMVMGTSAGILTRGLNKTMIKYIAMHRESPESWYIARTVMKVQVIYGLFISLGIYLGAAYFAHHFFHKPELEPYLKLCSIGVFGCIFFGYRTAIFQAFSKFEIEAAFTVSERTIYLLAILFLLSYGLLDIQTISKIYVILPLVISGCALYYMKNDFAKGKDGLFLNYLSTMGAKYGLVLFYTLCLWLTGLIHVFVLTRCFSLQEVGLYGFAYKIYNFFLLIMYSINSVLLPTFSGISNKATLRGHYRKIIKATSIVIFCILPIIPFVHLFVKFFAGTKYIEATPMLQILIFGAAASIVLTPSISILFAFDKFKILALGGLTMVSVNVIGHLFITPQYGGLGAAIVQVLSALVMNCFFTIITYKVLFSKNSN